MDTSDDLLTCTPKHPKLMSSAHILYPGQYLFLLGGAEERDMMWRFQKPGHHPTPLLCYAHCVPLSGKTEPIRGATGWGGGDSVRCGCCGHILPETSGGWQCRGGKPWGPGAGKEGSRRPQKGLGSLGSEPSSNRAAIWWSPAVTGLLIFYFNMGTSLAISPWIRAPVSS